MIPIPGIGALRAIGIGLMVAGACSIVSGVVYYAKGRAAGRAEVQARWDAAERRRADVALQAQAEQRQLEQRQAAEQREALNEAERLSARARAGAAAAADSGRLFVAAARTAAVAGSGLRAPGAAAPASCSPAGAAAVLPADVLGALEQRLRDLAREADERGAAGGLCQASYDAVTDEPAPIPTDARK
ncbi:MAG TPA: DUF2514 family protein [Rhodanobacteraceae bacterium]|nr:DUF2514 family protein [Rhodanobacteraceae bacterium]